MMDHGDAAATEYPAIPWFDDPVQLHSSREDSCSLPTAEHCEWRSSYWLYWYQADIVYGYGTVYFCCALIGVSAIGYLLQRTFLSRQAKKRNNTSGNTLIQRFFAATRFLSYRVVSIKALRWYSPAIGVILIGCAAWVFFGILTLGPKPYYWPNTEEINYGNSPPIATRTGWMAVALLPFTVALAAKWNLITVLTGLSHERLQVFHRWSSWLMFVLALIHTFPFIIYHIQQGDMMEKWKTDMYYWTGVAALVPQAWLNFMSIGPIRNLFYETFKVFHYINIALFLAFFFLHCGFRLTSWDYFVAVLAIYGFSLLVSWGRTYGVYGFSHRATLRTELDGTIRMSVSTRANWRPGQHMFLRFLTPAVGVHHTLTNHPFSICSLPAREDEKRGNELVFYLRPHNGITRRLRSISDNDKDAALPVQLDGPYGGVYWDSFDGFSKLLFITGGSGSGAMLPLLETVVRRNQRVKAGEKEGGLESGTTLDLEVVLAARQIELFYWFKDAVKSILSTPVRINFRVSVYITDSAWSSSTEHILTGKSPNAATSGLQSPGDDDLAVTLHSGRPDVNSLIQNTVTNTAAPVAISACGPPSMMHDVRNAAAAAQVRIATGNASTAPDVYLHTENFFW